MIPYLSLSYSSHQNADCTTECINHSFGSEQITPDSSYSYSFKLCSWDSCIREPGGAISSTTPGASITITACTINNCNSTKPNTTPTYSYNGGAIYANGIKEFAVSSSSFICCCAPQTTHDNGGAGGIFAYDIKTTVSLSSSHFISCFAGAAGGGAHFESIKTSSVGPQTVNNCRFVQCVAEGISPDGGGLNLWYSTYTPGCSNCLFSQCEAQWGGGLDFTSNGSPDRHPIRFSFFNNNSVISGGSGKDIYFYSPQGTPCLHCFSTTESPRIGGASAQDNDWLPLTRLRL